MPKAVKQRQRAMSDTAFERKYEPILLNDECDRRVFQDLDPMYINDHHVWSIMESDDGNHEYLVPGYHRVNINGYVQTKKPWTDEDDASGLQVKYT